MQSQSFFGADSFVHSLMMRGIDPAKFDVHVACTTEVNGSSTPVIERLRAIPGITVRPTRFGPTIFSQRRSKVVRSLGSVVPAAIDLARLAVYVRRHNIRIIHTSEKPRDAVYGVALSKLTRTRSAVQMHVMFHDQISSKVRWAMRNASALISISDFVTGSLVTRGLPADKIHTVLNSIDVDAWESGRDGSPMRERLGIGPDEVVVLIAARIFKWKGHRELFESMAPVLREHTYARIVVVGEDDRRAQPGGTSFTAELRELAAGLGIDRQVTFAGFQEDMEEVFAMADIFGMPSYEEPFGLVFLEAMAMRKPVVALRSGGAPEIVVHGVTGLLSDPGDSETLTAHLRLLVESREERAAMGLRGRERAEAHFRPERMARDIEAAYEQMLGGGVAESKSPPRTDCQVPRTQI